MATRYACSVCGLEFRGRETMPRCPHCYSTGIATQQRPRWSTRRSLIFAAAIALTTLAFTWWAVRPANQNMELEVDVSQPRTVTVANIETAKATSTAPPVVSLVPVIPVEDDTRGAQTSSPTAASNQPARQNDSEKIVLRDKRVSGESQKDLDRPEPAGTEKTVERTPVEAATTDTPDLPDDKQADRANDPPVIEEATSQAAAFPQLRDLNRNVRWPSPLLTDENYQEWLKYLWPTDKELKWRKIRWHKELSTAAVEARRLQRPILLWTMNGHPCGET